MYIQHLNLTNFRNYSRLALDLPPGIAILTGENAQGKTNLLDALFYLSRTKSARTNADRELVNWLALEDDLPFVKLVARVCRGQESMQVELALLQNMPEAASTDATTWRKSIRINGVNTRAIDAVGAVNVVLFLPQDIEIVASSPQLRRNYLDDTICQVDPHYNRELQRYGRVLTQRNHLLKALRGRSHDESQLAFWNERLVKHGAYVSARREQAIQHLGMLAERIHTQLTGDQERLVIEYRCSILSSKAPVAAWQLGLTAEAPASALPLPERQAQLATAFSQRLQESQGREVEQGMSLVGPHRDDMGFLSNGIDMTVYGSRGQQRTTALSLKLAEVEWVTVQKGDRPVLLLDDVLSELDGGRRNFLLAAIHTAQQVLMTTNDLSNYPPEFLNRAALWVVRGGCLEPFTQP